MNRAVVAALTAFAVSAVAFASRGIDGQPPAQPAGSEWRSYAGDLRNHHYSPLAQIAAANFNALEVAWRFKTDSLGPASRIQARRHAADGQRRALHDRRHAARGRRARRGDRRAALGARGARRRARGGVAAAAVGPRRRLLDRRPRRADPLRHDRLPAGRARREDRRAHRRRSATTASSI